jgi:uncharacterized protein (DUF849 family)
MLLQAALNGPLTKDDHPEVPITADELARDAKACVEAGAGAIHMHPRDGDGRESLHAEVIDAAVRRVRAACGVPVGVSTGEWIEPDLGRRLELISQWTEPDYASVNVSEDGSLQVMRALTKRGIGVEAGVWSVEDAQRLASFDVGDGLTRILIEPVNVPASEAVALVAAIRAAVGTGPILQHGDGEATWVLVEDAARHGLDTRIGLEDTHEDDNVALVQRAMNLIRAAGL